MLDCCETRRTILKVRYLVGSYRSKVGERVRPFLVTSVAVLVAMVKLVVRMVDFISQVSGLTVSLI